MTVAQVVERAGVSRRTFYGLFDDCEDCSFAAFEQAFSDFCGCVLVACEGESGWRERVRAGLLALLCLLDEQPAIGRFLIVESQVAGVATRKRRAEIVAVLTEAIERGREHARASSAIPSLTGEGVVGGVLAVIHSRLAGPNSESLAALANPLMSMIVLPYLGVAAARRELDRPNPVLPGRAHVELLHRDPFKAAGIRLTYRTVRVLTAIADHPGASNRLLADTAEISDQGQISRLLRRLERVGMVTNTGLGSGSGGPNAWTLTTTGRQVVSTIKAHTEERRSGNYTR